MSLRLQIVIGIILLIAFVIIVNMIRKKKLDLRYGLSWLCLLIIAIILDIFPVIIIKLADLAGVDIPSNMVFFVGLIFVIVLIYSSTVSISHLSQRVKRLTQELALMQKELEELKNDSM